MKKNFLYAMLAIGIMASCSKEAYVETPPESDGISDNDAMPIMISASSATANVSVGSRSVGSVGADGSSMTNQWNGQTLTMFAFPKNLPVTAEEIEGTVGTTQITNDKSKSPFFARTAIAATAAETGSITWTDNGVVYFPRNGAYDFFGYHSDGAVNTPTFDPIKGIYSARFVIDGSQDLLYAKAALTSAQKQTLGSEDSKKAFSSYTARKAIQPNMTFNHLLTRLTFTLKAAPDVNRPSEPAKGSTEVYIRSITVKSKSTGTFYVITNDKFTNPLAFDDTKNVLTLKERTADKNSMQALDAERHTDQNKKALYVGTAPGYTYLKKNATVIENAAKWMGKYPATLAGTLVGEGLLVAPDTEYDIVVEVMQYYDGDGNMIIPPTDPDAWHQMGDSKDQRYYRFEVNTKDLAGSTNFEASSTYNINIVMYGLQGIDLNATLNKWKIGKEFTYNPEDQGFK